jgi:hypothetical protein
MPLDKIGVAGHPKALGVVSATSRPAMSHPLSQNDHPHFAQPPVHIFFFSIFFLIISFLIFLIFI